MRHSTTGTRRALAVAAALALGTSFGGRAHAAGADVFNDNCAVCHSTEPGVNKLGPSLAGVVGRPSASLADFPYSPAMANAHLTWTKAELDRYLTNPQAMVKGTKMTFPGLKSAKDRKALIDYLATLKSEPS